MVECNTFRSIHSTKEKQEKFCLVCAGDNCDKMKIEVSRNTFKYHKEIYSEENLPGIHLP